MLATWDCKQTSVWYQDLCCWTHLWTWTQGSYTWKLLIKAICTFSKRYFEILKWSIWKAKCKTKSLKLNTIDVHGDSRDALYLDLGWPIQNVPLHCVCCDPLSVQYIMLCAVEWVDSLHCITIRSGRYLTNCYMRCAENTFIESVFHWALYLSIATLRCSCTMLLMAMATCGFLSVSVMQAGVTCTSFSNYTAWKWQLEKTNTLHQLA